MPKKKDATDEELSKMRKLYFQQYSKYERLGMNLKQALEGFLEEAGISFLAVNYRVKSLESFMEKIGRKHYANPFDQTEDMCGLRVVCYFQSDIEKIKKLICSELTIVESFDKSDHMSPTQFGYRSSHFIVKIRKDWLKAPNYRGLQNLKAEIQVRTILMHSWAEIEHKLAYKKKEHIPDQFRRKFSRLSAKLEEADEQFEELVQGIWKHQTDVLTWAEEKPGFDWDMEMNLDNLQAFLDFHFPEKQKDIKDTIELLDEILPLEITMKDLVEGYEQVRKHLPEIEKSMSNIRNYFQQVTACRNMLDIVHEKYFEMRGMPNEGVVMKWRVAISN